ncbi:DUF6344 domain-containing protein [Streptomyces sp. CBMA29]|uniref:DUF6344 domain-containing protein n=1 Tax=Streptomyces sp. CBMA29 TaxID=1896314 RepID=UPI001661BC27|nr:DUF6344 domain-containing protein [Streptomyces sp. CBMA29]MBD0736221.1 hypothetical protein [Streptomyces sp. CBMA29]
MNVFTNVTAFWNAFVGVLLKLVAGLGFATPARTARVRTAAAQAAAVPAAAVANGTAAAPDAAPTPARTPSCAALLPAPRPGSRSLPPTMKQRIRAEAHGSSPSARSIAPDTGEALPYPASPALADHALTSTADEAVLVR